MMTAPDAAGGGEFASRDPIIERGTQSPGENDDDGNGPGGGRGGGGGGGVGTGVEAARGGGGGGFPLEVEDLVRLMDFTRTPPEKVIETLASWGGVPGTCKALAVDPQHGLRDSEILAEQCERRTRYGVNQMPPLILPTLLEHAWEALHDVTLICLLVAAAVSLGFGLYVDASSHGEEPDVHWVEGFAIFLAVFIIVSITAVNNYKKDGLLRQQAAEAENVRSAVRRNGDSTDIPVQEILVGDVVLLKDGDIVPVDGLVIESHNGKCDESSATGESDAIKKKRFEADENGPGARGGAGGGHAVGGKPPRPGAGPATLSVDLEEGPLDFTPVVKGKSSSTPYLVQSGTKVNEGTVTVVALCVGVNSRYGLLLKEVKKEVEDTPLQKALARLAASIGWFGLGAALLQLLILTIKLVVKGVEGGWSADMNWGASTASGEPQDPSLVGKDGLVLAIVNIIIQAVTIIVVAVPEGLPMAVTIALIYGTRKMAQRNNFVRQLAACETMGGATTICTDKTGTLTENKMTVVSGVLAEYAFDRTERARLSAALGDPDRRPAGGAGEQAGAFPNRAVIKLFRSAIVRNTKAFLTSDEQGGGGLVFRGDKTEAALLSLCLPDLQAANLKAERGPVVRTFPFSSKKKSMTSVAEASDCALNPNEKYHMYVKGAAEVVLASCSSYIDAAGKVTSFLSSGPDELIKKKEIYQSLDYYAKQCLRCIAVAYTPLTDAQYQSMRSGWEEKEAAGKDCDAEYGNRLIFIGLMGIEDPLRAGVDGAVRKVQNAGIVVRMVTGDNIVTATSIAMKAGILSHGGIAMEGPDFRKMHEEHLAFYARLAARETADDDEPGAGVSVDFAQEKYLSPVGSQSAIPTSPGGELPDRTAKRKTRGWIDLVLRSDVSEQADGQHQQQARNAEKARLSAFDKMLPKLRVLARSSPTDKQILVEHLKSLGETVAVTGDGANDGPALKTADVGFAMGIAGSGIAKEAASIILMDDNFCSVVTAVVWGRSVSDSVRKFLTFQLTVNVTAVTLALVTSIVDESSTSVLTAVQLLWVNLLMDTFGALALATDEPDEDEFMRRPPINNKRDPLISWNMRWMIAGQALWQTSVTLVLLYAGSSLFQLRNEDKQQHLQLRTIVFNAFVLCNLCNEVNARRIDKRFDIFGGIHKNPTFIAIVAGTLVVQFLIVHFGGEAFRTAPITAGQWAICVFVAVISLPLGILVRILFFRATPLAKPVRVGVYPTINPSWKRELLWRRAVRMALRQKSFGVDDRCADAGMTERDDEHGQHNNGDTMTIELPTPVYNRLRDALESKTSGAQSHSQKVGHRRSQTGTLFESVVAGIIAKNDREKAAEKGGGGGGGGEGENKEAAGRST